MIHLAGKKNRRIILQIAFAILFIFIGIYFIKHEGTELSEVRTAISESDKIYIGIGLILVFIFVLVQGFMYKYSFRAIQKNINLKSGILLYLKRNFISVFLPAGMFTNMFFFSKDIQDKFIIDKTNIFYASTIFSICSVVSSIFIAIPALILLFIKGGFHGAFVWGLIGILLLLILLAYIILSIRNKGYFYGLLEKKFPKLFDSYQQMRSIEVDKPEVYKVLAFSIGIEIIGIAHLYLAMLALHLPPSFTVAIIGYALVLIILLSSPLLRGIGIIEVSLTYSLTLYGYSTLNAISVALIFRFFEFWSVLVLGIFSFLTKKENILFRVTPAISIFILGLVNIISAITPTLPGRLSLLRKWIPIEAIQASGWFVLFSGIAMLMLAVFLFRGIKSAWKIAIFLAAVSLFANLAKGIDWEEAIVTTIVLIFLLISRDQYISKKVTPIRKVFWFPSIISFLFVLVFGTFGFYSLDLKHFNIDFTFWESFKETITAFFLMNVDLKPGTTFGKTFLFSIHIMGLLTMILWVYQALKPYISRGSSLREEEVLLAKSLLTKYGNSSLDYFKTYKDKSFWFNADKSSFVSYKTSLDFAFVLENPVAINESVLKTTILDFDKFCENNGLKPVYYRIPEISLDIYKQMDKIFLPIGEEGVIDLKCFSTNGSDKKATRNAVNKLSKSGFLFKAYEPPLKDGFIQQIKAVSDEWLFEMKHKELVFAQGIFDENELKTQPVFTVENPEGRIEAFVNLIPNFSPGEANFDLMRKTNSAPNGTMDFLFVKMFEQMKLMGYSYCNIGLVPMSGIQQPHSIGESSMKLAYEKLKSFSQYRSLYQFKEKFDPSWRMTYLVYDEAFDLIFIPRALKNLMRNK